MIKCKCGEEAAFFHSKCCGKHFEIVIKNGKFSIVCEKCGKFVANIKMGD
jgi:hypothetical protein